MVVQVSGRYGIHVSQLLGHIIGLYRYLATTEARECSTLDRPQGFWDKANFTGKKASAGTGFEGSKFRDFSVPPGHMACM